MHSTGTPTAIGEDVRIGRYITSEAIRLGASGLLAGVAAGLVWRAAGRMRWGSAPFVVALLAAAGLTGRFEGPRWHSMVAVGAVLAMLAGAGTVRFLADPATHWAWVGIAALISDAGVWAGVPETGPALLAGGTFVGLVATASLTRARWAPSAGIGVAAAIGWAALSGAVGRPWAALGGTLCTGVAPWFALHPLLPMPPGRRGPPLWLLGGHLAVVILSARWIAVDPHAGWGRVAVAAVAGGVVATFYRPQA